MRKSSFIFRLRAKSSVFARSWPAPSKGAILSKALSAAELFGRFAAHPRRRLRRAERNRAQIDFSELNEGDLVVHLEHGIGRFLGLVKIGRARPPGAPEPDVADGSAIHPYREEQEVLALEFADEAKLYVPLEQAYLVSRYVGAGRKSPPLSLLGDRRW